MNRLNKFLKNKKNFIFCGILIIIIFILDVYTKRLAFEKVDNLYNETNGFFLYIKITSFFNIVKVVNNGVSFGLLSNFENASIFISIVTFSILIFLIYLLWKSKDNYDRFAYSLILGGGFGNLYDRIIFGGVYDFLDFHIKDYHWPAFNLADSAICIAVFILIFKDFIIFLRKKLRF